MVALYCNEHNEEEEEEEEDEEGQGIVAEYETYSHGMWTMTISTTTTKKKIMMMMKIKSAITAMILENDQKIEEDDFADDDVDIIEGNEGTGSNVNVNNNTFKTL